MSNKATVQNVSRDAFYYVEGWEEAKPWAKCFDLAPSPAQAPAYPGNPISGDSNSTRPGPCNGGPMVICHDLAVYGDPCSCVTEWKSYVLDAGGPLATLESCNQ